MSSLTGSAGDRHGSPSGFVIDDQAAHELEFNPVDSKELAALVLHRAELGYRGERRLPT